MATVRLQKVLAHAGVASRRAAEAMIASGRVRVDGQLVTELGTKVDPRGSRVEVDGRRVIAESLVYLVLHKPRSVVSTMHDPEGRPTVRDLFTHVAGRVYPIGRLDFATSGVLLATNDGDFAEGLMHPRRGVPKTYVIKVQGEMGPKDLDAWRFGVELEDGKTLPAKVKLLRHEGDKTWFQLTITEGRNQQVRRMGDATGFRVMRLARTEFAGVSSEGLRPGEWRYLTADELATMKADYGVPKRAVSPPREPPRASPEPPRPRDTARSREEARPREMARSRDAARPARQGARPPREGAPSHDGARPTREGARPTREGARPSREGARPTREGARPSREGARPSRGEAPSHERARPSHQGARPTRDGAPSRERVRSGGPTRASGPHGRPSSEPARSHEPARSPRVPPRPSREGPLAHAPPRGSPEPRTPGPRRRGDRQGTAPGGRGGTDASPRTEHGTRDRARGSRR